MLAAQVSEILQLSLHCGQEKPSSWVTVSNFPSDSPFAHWRAELRCQSLPSKFGFICLRTLTVITLMRKKYIIYWGVLKIRHPDMIQQEWKILGGERIVRGKDPKIQIWCLSLHSWNFPEDVCIWKQMQIRTFFHVFAYIRWLKYFRVSS